MMDDVTVLRQKMQIKTNEQALLRKSHNGRHWVNLRRGHQLVNFTMGKCTVMA